MNTIIKQDVRNIAIAIKKEARMLEGKTLVISGGAGFIGSYIVRTVYFLNTHSFRKQCHVVVMDNFKTSKRRDDFDAMESGGVEILECDVTKPFLAPGSADYIIHAAGLASPVYYRKYPMETIEAAIFGTKNLLELAKAKKTKSFLFFSSSEIYGDPDPNFIPTPETYRGNVSPVGPRACYDESKRMGEAICYTYGNMFGVPVKIVRPFNIYGPGMRPDDYRVVPTFLTYALKGKPLPVHDQGNQTRTFCYITDAVTAFFKVLLLGNAGDVFNVGNDDNEINMMSLANVVKEIAGNEVEIQKIEYPDSYPKDEPRRRCPDLTKIKSSLGYTPMVDLHTGLTRTLRWFAQELHEQGTKVIRVRV